MSNDICYFHFCVIVISNKEKSAFFLTLMRSAPRTHLTKILVDPRRTTVLFASRSSKFWRYVVMMTIINSMIFCSRSVSSFVHKTHHLCHSRRSMVVSTEKINKNKKFKAAVNAVKFVNRLPPAPQEGVEFAKLPWNLNLPDHHYYVHLTTDPESGWTLEHYDPETDGGILTDVTDDEYKSLKHYGQSPLPLYPSTTSLK